MSGIASGVATLALFVCHVSKSYSLGTPVPGICVFFSLTWIRWRMEWLSLSLGDAGFALKIQLSCSAAMETAKPAKTFRTNVGDAFGMLSQALPSLLASLFLLVFLNFEERFKKINPGTWYIYLYQAKLASGLKRR